MKRFIAALCLVMLAASAYAADNFAINNATGTFTILKSIDDGTGAQQLVIKLSGAPATLTPLGYQQLTSLSAATALTVPAGTTLILAEVESSGTSVRWRDDGTNPTVTVGMELLQGSQLSYSGTLSAIKFIQTSASAKLNVSYYK